MDAMIIRPRSPAGRELASYFIVWRPSFRERRREYSLRGECQNTYRSLVESSYRLISNVVQNKGYTSIYLKY
jgi:hypothetical protein